MDLHEQLVGSIAEAQISHRFVTHGRRVSALVPLRENPGNSAHDPNPEPAIGPRTGRSNLQEGAFHPVPEYQNSIQYP
jgi:hypothetical protein